MPQIRIDDVFKKTPGRRPPESKMLSFTGSKDFSVVDGTVLKFITKNRQTITNGDKCIIAAFDMDQTIITTKSGLKFGRNGYDWKLLDWTNKFFNSKLTNLKKSHPQHKVIVVIFTNQNGCLPKPTSKSQLMLKTKLSGISKKLPIDYAFASMKAPTLELKGQYRKPASGMFDQLKLEIEKFEAEIDMDLSFYVGDAAGRPGDHSADDLGFAENSNLKFFTPEEYFKDEENSI